MTHVTLVARMVVSVLSVAALSCWLIVEHPGWLRGFGWFLLLTDIIVLLVACATYSTWSKDFLSKPEKETKVKEV